jgi:hypothetical protein
MHWASVLPLNLFEQSVINRIDNDPSERFQSQRPKIRDDAKFIEYGIKFNEGVAAGVSSGGSTHEAGFFDRSGDLAW